MLKPDNEYSKLITFFKFNFTKNSAPEVVYFICMMGIHASLPNSGQRNHICSLKLAAIGIFTPWKLANATNKGLVYCFVDFPGPSISNFFCKLIVNILGFLVHMVFVTNTQLLH